MTHNRKFGIYVLILNKAVIYDSINKVILFFNLIWKHLILADLPSVARDVILSWSEAVLSDR